MSEGRETVPEMEEGAGPGVEEEYGEWEYEEVEDDEQKDEPTEETARQTVERVLREAQDKDSGGEDSKEVTPEESPSDQKQEVKQEAKPEKEAPDYRPPERFNAEEKEVFNKAPKEIKAAIAKMVKNHEAKFTQTQQAATAAQREAQHIVETVRPYLHAHPELIEAGYTESKIIAGLIASHQKLTNPETALGKWIEIGAEIGVDPETLQTLAEENGGVQHQQQLPPQFQELQEKVNRIDSMYQQGQEQYVKSQVDSITAELKAVADEQDPATGQYLRPELHEDQFIERAKPLVSAYVATIPGISYGDALKKAHADLTGRQTGDSHTQQQQTRLPSNNPPQRATTGAVSVRGRSAQTNASTPQEIPPEALGNARDSVKWALQQLRRG